ncbi:glycosyltransferase, partial [Flavobacteriaceae bacterium]|nr:glycosyltransferase [Flavobacteriaceae bacterium]
LVGLTESQIRNLPKNIIGVSKTENQTELRDFYNISDVFLNLSVEETFGLTTAEALACGTPAIVYDSTASPELIDNKTGIIVKKGRIQDLLVAVNAVKNKGSSFYSESCRERAINLFNKDIRFMDYFKLYNNILSKNQ